MANFSENCKNHSNVRASNYGIKNHYKVYKIQHLALTIIITYNANFSSIKFCCWEALKCIFLQWLHGHILSQ